MKIIFRNFQKTKKIDFASQQKAFVEVRAPISKEKPVFLYSSHASGVLCFTGVSGRSDIFLKPSSCTVRIIFVLPRFKTGENYARYNVTLENWRQLVGTHPSLFTTRGL